jgi:hypothetical protein
MIDCHIDDFLAEGPLEDTPGGRITYLLLLHLYASGVIGEIEKAIYIQKIIQKHFSNSKPLRQ